MPLTNAQQFLLELINRARLDPLAEVALTPNLSTIDGNLTPGTLSDQPVHALASNALLNMSSQAHSDWMAVSQVFSHVGQGNSAVWQRILSAGYQWNGYGENLSLIYGNGTFTVEGSIASWHQNLFHSDGHRGNVLGAGFREVGSGGAIGHYTPGSIEYNAAYLTENFGRSGSDIFLTGVVFDDADTDGFYDMGEGVAGVSFSIGGQTATSEAAGGYNLQLAQTSNAQVSISFGGQTANVIVDLSGESVKLDVINPNGAAMLLTAGTTTLVGGFLQDARILGAVEADLTGDARANQLIGSRGANDLSGLAGRDTISAEDGNDTVDGGDGNDLINGGAGNDLLRGGTYHDTINAGSGNDTVYADNGRDLVRLGTGDDVFHDNGQDDQYGNDRVYGWTGQDTINGGGGRDSIWGGQHEDLLYGGANDDMIRGGSYADTIYGGAGNDRVWGDNGADRVFLGSGNDVFHDNTQSGAFGQDSVWGGTGNDTLNGAGGDDVLSGQWGNDVVQGGAGNDTLSGGIGDDTLTGGDGSDVFQINATLSPGQDRITDFADGTDRVEFDNLVFADLTIAAQGADTRVSWAQGSVVLEGLMASDITMADFDFI